MLGQVSEDGVHLGWRQPVQRGQPGPQQHGPVLGQQRLGQHEGYSAANFTAICLPRI
jgi:hypothetical protein